MFPAHKQNKNYNSSNLSVHARARVSAKMTCQNIDMDKRNPVSILFSGLSIFSGVIHWFTVLGKERLRLCSLASLHGLGLSLLHT